MLALYPQFFIQIRQPLPILHVQHRFRVQTNCRHHRTSALCLNREWKVRLLRNNGWRWMTSWTPCVSGYGSSHDTEENTQPMPLCDSSIIGGANSISKAKKKKKDPPIPCSAADVFTKKLGCFSAGQLQIEAPYSYGGETLVKIDVFVFGSGGASFFPLNPFISFNSNLQGFGITVSAEDRSLGDRCRLCSHGETVPVKTQIVKNDRMCWYDQRLEVFVSNTELGDDSLVQCKYCWHMRWLSIPGWIFLKTHPFVYWCFVIDALWIDKSWNSTRKKMSLWKPITPVDVRDIFLFVN